MINRKAKDNIYNLLVLLYRVSTLLAHYDWNTAHSRFLVGWNFHRESIDKVVESEKVVNEQRNSYRVITLNHRGDTHCEGVMCASRNIHISFALFELLKKTI